MDNINSDNKIIIDNYIRDHDCKINQTRTEFINGNAVILQGYELPRKLVFYNIKNGRFAKEYVKILRDEGGTLNPELEEDAKKITDLLLGLSASDTRKTLDDIKKRGQVELGLITNDGYLIDGNRRMSVLTKLFEDEKDQRYDTIKVARLAGPISSKDLWAMEAQISLSQDPKVRYGPLNELLKLDEGRRAGFTSAEIAELLYGVDDPVQIDESLARLDLIKKYLKEYYQDEENLSLVEGFHEHFEDLQSILKSGKNRKKSVDELTACQKVGFRLIFDRVSHMRIRAIDQAIKNDYSLEKIIHAANVMEEKKEHVDDDDDDISPTVVRFTDFEDEVKVRRNEEQIPLILSSILNNFGVLKFDNPELKTAECTYQIQKILEYMKKLSDLKVS